MLNDDIAIYFGDADRFVDLNTLGAERLRDAVPAVEVAGRHHPGRAAARLPRRSPGPPRCSTAHDLFAQAGLPSEPDDVASCRADVGGLLRVRRGAAEGAARPVPDHRRQDRLHLLDGAGAAEVHRPPAALHRRPGARPAGLGPRADRRPQELTAGSSTTAAPRAPSTGTPRGTPARRSASSTRPGSPVRSSESAPGTAGKWRRVPQPRRPGNQGGSFIAITRYCPQPRRRSRSSAGCSRPANQARHYVDVGLFPSSAGGLRRPDRPAPDPFFGGQVTVDVFARVGKGRAARLLQPLRHRHQRHLHRRAGQRRSRPARTRRGLARRPRPRSTGCCDERGVI